jgi:RHS repeat-associated protein
MRMTGVATCKSRVALGLNVSSSWNRVGFGRNTNHLTSAVEKDADGNVLTQATYSYDALGNRISETVTDGSSNASTTQFVYAPSGQLIGEMADSGQWTAYLANPQASNQFLARVDGNGVTWLLTDHQGSVTVALSADGSQVVAQANYDAFGNVTLVSGTAADLGRLGWQGGMTDSATGSDHFGDRDYDPTTGRWGTPDPANADINTYRGMGNSPTNESDPSGLDPNMPSRADVLAGKVPIVRANPPAPVITAEMFERAMRNKARFADVEEIGVRGGPGLRAGQDWLLNPPRTFTGRFGASLSLDEVVTFRDGFGDTIAAKDLLGRPYGKTGYPFIDRMSAFQGQLAYEMQMFARLAVAAGSEIDWDELGRLVGGLASMGFGAMLILAPDPTCASKVIGLLLIAEGTDTSLAGGMSLESGQHQATLRKQASYNALIARGVSHETADKVSTGIDVGTPIVLNLAGGGAELAQMLRASRSLSASAGGSALTKAMKVPKIDPSLAGTTDFAYTTASGDVFLQPGLSRAQQRLYLRHESVHVSFTPRGSGTIATLRQNVGMAAYNNSALVQGLEELMAHSYAAGSLRQGWTHTFSGAYSTRLYRVTPITAGGELIIYVGGTGVAAYGAYRVGQNIAGE